MAVASWACYRSAYLTLSNNFFAVLFFYFLILVYFTLFSYFVSSLPVSKLFSPKDLMWFGFDSLNLCVSKSPVYKAYP